MGTKITQAKKGKYGSARKYLSRAQALRKLQLSLADFRRLCILKGVYPRVPKHKHSGNATYYYAKDINFLLHEPLLHKFRQIKAHDRRVMRKVHRSEYFDANKMRENAPEYNLDHLVLERYPTFFDAVADLDDALSTIHLFASLASSDDIPKDVVYNCEKLAREWQYYVVMSGCLKKSFVSIKGIYYEAEVAGKVVRWLVPHNSFNMRASEADVDYRVLLTFLDFYQVHVGFVLFNLFQSELGMARPSVDTESDAAGCWLSAIRVFKKNDEGVVCTDEAPRLSFVGSPNRLFSGLTFFVNREVPAQPLELVLMASGAVVSLELSEHPDHLNRESDTITHQIVDRPVVGDLVEGRTYVQPQWVFDSLNAGILLPADEYAPGRQLPPHLSPFVSTDESDETVYVPDRAKEIAEIVEKHRAASAAGFSGDVEGEVASAVMSVAQAKAKLEQAEGRAALAAPGEFEDQQTNALGDLFAAEVRTELAAACEDDGFLGADDVEESESESVEAGSADIEIGDDEVKTALDVDAELSDSDEETEDHRLRRMMMRKKDAKLYAAMQHGIKKRRDEKRMLEKKAEALAGKKRRRSHK